MGPVPVGGGTPIAVQSMTKTDTRDVPATVEQIRRLEAAGCEIIRVTAQTKRHAANLEHIVAGLRAAGFFAAHADYETGGMQLPAGIKLPFQ